MPDYDFYHGLYSGQQVDSAVSRALVGGQLDQDIAAIRAAVGSPLVANTAAEMTNINKIYVYTGSEAGYSTGHWYYYEGGSWQDGGLYNSAAADSSMSDSSTNAVQNKVIKAYVDNTASGLSGDIEDLRTDVDAAILAEQTRAEGVEALKAPLASPALTGTPTAPTAAAGDNSTQIATTAYADNAVAVEKARAEAVEATKADKSFADYILLREEEDRQILFGSVVEAAEDEYSELRSSPIHNAITIGGSVYPRMNNTRMAIDRMLGRTVAFNQLIPEVQTVTNNGVTFTVDNVNHTITMTGTATENAQLVFYPDSTSNGFRGVNGHRYLIRWESFAEGYFIIINNTGIDASSNSTSKPTGHIFTVVDNTKGSGIILRVPSGNTINRTVHYALLFDLTAQYGTTLADQIYAMEQATTGAGVAYVRQRMDLDYYASNAGELKAPVVSGVSFVGFNIVNPETITNGKAMGSTGVPYDSANNFVTDYVSVIVNTDYYVGDNWESWIDCYNADKVFVGQITKNAQKIAHIPNGVAFVRFTGRMTIRDAACINISNASLNGQYRPYVAPTSLPLPSTRLDGVGTAQDVMYVREDGENDYSLIKAAYAKSYTFTGNETWEQYTDWSSQTCWKCNPSPISDAKAGWGNLCICSKYQGTGTPADVLGGSVDKSIIVNGSTWLAIQDTTVTSAAQAKTATTGMEVVYLLETPVESVIAEHLTLAEVSAIAENGGIISVENSNGHIVQPDMVCDVVVSRSAS